MEDLHFILGISLILFSFGFAIFSIAKKSSLLDSQNELYYAFVSNTNLKPFLVILDKVSKKAINLKIRLMFKKYFLKLLINTNAHQLPKVLVDLKKSKHSQVLLSEFSTAIYEDSSMGLMLSANIDNPKGMEVICEFIDSLPEDIKKEHYKNAARVLEDDRRHKYYDYPMDFQKDVKAKIEEFTQKSLK